MSSHDEIVFDHIAVGVPDPDALTPLLAGELGAEPYESGPGGGFTWWQWQFEGGGVLEVLEPDGPRDGFLYRFLDSRGPGVHHVTFKVPDHPTALRRAEALGYQPVGVNTDSEGWKEAFLHPKQAQGIVVQIVEAGDGDGDYPRPDFPPIDSRAATPCALRGLRTSASSAETARRQWGELLGGSERETNEGLVFEWPGSPMRIVVRVDAESEQGPLGLEISEEIHATEGPHPLLGTALIGTEP